MSDINIDDVLARARASLAKLDESLAQEGSAFAAPVKEEKAEEESFRVSKPQVDFKSDYTRDLSSERDRLSQFETGYKREHDFKLPDLSGEEDPIARLRAFRSALSSETPTAAVEVDTAPTPEPFRIPKAEAPVVQAAPVEPDASTRFKPSSISDSPAFPYSNLTVETEPETAPVFSEPVASATGEMESEKFLVDLIHKAERDIEEPAPAGFVSVEETFQPQQEPVVGATAFGTFETGPVAEPAVQFDLPQVFEPVVDAEIVEEPVAETVQVEAPAIFTIPEVPLPSEPAVASFQSETAAFDLPVVEPEPVAFDLPVVEPEPVTFDLPEIEPEPVGFNLPEIEPVPAAFDLPKIEPEPVTFDLPEIETTVEEPVAFDLPEIETVVEEPVYAEAPAVEPQPAVPAVDTRKAANADEALFFFRDAFRSSGDWYTGEDEDPYSLIFVVRDRIAGDDGQPVYPTENATFNAATAAMFGQFENYTRIKDTTERIDTWTSNRIRKIVKRAHGAKWDKALEYAASGVIPAVAVTAEDDAAAVLCFAPMKLSEQPKALAQLQVTGLELPHSMDIAVPENLPVGSLIVVVEEKYGMSTGKAVAQACHAVQLAFRELDDTQFNTWMSSGMTVKIVRGYADERYRYPIEVHDAGFTEVESHSRTAVAYQVMR